MTHVEVRNHTRQNHDFHMTRFKRCVYCLNGCEIIEDAGGEHELPAVLL